MALPNVTTGLTQAGVNPVDVQQKKDRDQKIAEILDNISARLGNINNVRSNTQSAVFEAFGNNFISRSISQTMDQVVDSFKSLIIGKKDQVDPQLDLAKQQLKILTETNQKIVKIDETIRIINDTLIGSRHDARAHLDFDKAAFSTNNLLLEQIRALLEGPETPPPAASTTIDTPGPIQPAGGDAVNDSRFISFSEPNFVDFGYTQRETVAAVNEPMFSPRPDPDDRVWFDINHPPSRNDDTITRVDESANDQSAKPTGPVVNESDTVETTLNNILDVLTNISSDVDIISSSEPITTQESEMESNRVTLASRVTDRDMVDDALPPGSNKFDWSRLITGWTDMDANLRGLANIAGEVTLLFSSLVPQLARLLPLVSGLVAILPVSLMAYAAYEATDWAENASILDPEGNLTNTGAVLELAHNAVGSTVKPETGITEAERIAVFAESRQHDVYKQRYSNAVWAGEKFKEETAESLKKHFNITVPEKQIIRSVESVEKVNADKAEELERKKKEVRDHNNSTNRVDSSSGAVNVSNQTIMNNQTIMATRPIVQNPDDSYNRYLTSVMA